MTVYIVFTVGTGTLAGHTETNPVFCCRLVQITTTCMKHDYSYRILFGHIQFYMDLNIFGSGHLLMTTLTNHKKFTK